MADGGWGSAVLGGSLEGSFEKYVHKHVGIS